MVILILLLLLLFVIAKVKTLPVGGTAPGFASFPMATFLFTYKPDLGVVDNYIINRFSFIASTFSPS